MKKLVATTRLGRKIVAANWKMHKTPHLVRGFLEQFRDLLKTSELLKSGEPKSLANLEMIFFPQALCGESMDLSLVALRHELGISNVHWGVQNGYPKESGAYTGEVSPITARSMGAHFVLIGHSERRSLFSEQDSFLSEKVKFSLENELTPLFCIGETLEERDSGGTTAVLVNQLQKGLESSLGDENLVKRLIVAYEPVWAIGTGRVATREQVQEAHQAVRQELSRMGLSEVPILYGGSVKPDNAKSLASLPNVGGFLVGGASLEPESFLRICEATNS